ncbi:MAG: hypothetical protein R2852_09515 [Bacteroidia bacterium]
MVTPFVCITVEVFASVSFGYSVAKKCACEGTSTKEGCCDEKTIQVNNLDKQFKASQFSVFSAKNTSELLCVYPVFKCPAYAMHVNSFFTDSHHPPNKNKTPLYMLNQVFRI